MKWVRQWWRRDKKDGVDEARWHLEQLEARDDQVAELGRQLRAAQRDNHFSELVNEAIRVAKDSPT